MARLAKAKSVSFPPELAERLEVMAKANGVSFSELVSELCSRSLHIDFDVAFVPHVSEVVHDSADDVVSRLSSYVEVALEPTPRRLSRASRTSARGLPARCSGSSVTSPWVLLYPRG